MKVLVEFDVRSDLGSFEEQLRLWTETKAGDTIDGYRTDAGGHGLRPALFDFAVEMEKKLRKNDHKKGWQTYPIEALVKLLHIEYNELEVALEFGIGDAASESVDIANFAMMLRDRLKNQPKEEPKASVEPSSSKPTISPAMIDHPIMTGQTDRT